ncbi:MAG: 30S ribosome-binding factor RbfA [Actinomycetota bacterium]
MPDAKRTDRVGEEFREILAEEIPKLKDPRVGFVTVIGVDVAPDLKRALVFYTVLGEERERKATRAALRSATGHLRRVIGREVRLRVLPDLEFKEDETITSTQRVDELLNKIKENDAGP